MNMTPAEMLNRRNALIARARKLGRALAAANHEASPASDVVVDAIRDEIAELNAEIAELTAVKLASGTTITYNLNPALTGLQGTDDDGREALKIGTGWAIVESYHPNTGRVFDYHTAGGSVLSRLNLAEVYAAAERWS